MPTAAQREKWALLTALGCLVALCWFYLIHMDRQMPGMSGAMTGDGWSSADWLMMLAMWAIMMTAMMVPTAIRAVLIFARIGDQARRLGRSYASPYWFSAGYVAIWSGFGIGATLLQWTLTQAAMLSPMMRAANWHFGAVLLVIAGVWQLTPWKAACLKHCQSPATFIAQHFRPGRHGALLLGMMHGSYCVGCCWGLMFLLFLGGVMNLVWIGIITAFVLAEKLLPPKFGFSKAAGWLMVASGIGTFLFLESL